ncbi:MAG TPA: hypothetical protein VF074_06740 [Pyrinomonadaceae bacterium]
MTRKQVITYEEIEREQRDYCASQNVQYLPAYKDSNASLALATQGRIPINGLRHPPEGEHNGWFLWSGEELSTDPMFFSNVHTHHLMELRPEVLKFPGLPPGHRFLLDGHYLDVWFDPSLLNV